MPFNIVKYYCWKLLNISSYYLWNIIVGISLKPERISTRNSVRSILESIIICQSSQWLWCISGTRTTKSLKISIVRQVRRVMREIMSRYTGETQLQFPEQILGEIVRFSCTLQIISRRTCTECCQRRYNYNQNFSYY